MWLTLEKNYGILILIFLITNNVKSFKIKNLSPGVHIQPLGSCEVKATELFLTVNTTLSINEDIQKIDKHVLEFPEVCSIKHPDLQRYCMELYKRVSEEAVFTKNKILAECSEPKSRTKRGVYGMVFNAGSKLWQFASKYSVHIIGATVAYQGYKISDLGSKLDSKEKSIKNTLKLMLNASEHELQNHENFLNKLVDIGNNASYREKITEFADANIEVFNIMKQRYENIFDLKPVNVLMEQMKNNNDLKTLRLPSFNKFEDIFEKSHKTKFCTNDTIMLEFQIPLVKNDNFHKYSIILVPTETREIIVVNNKPDLVTNVVVDMKNETFVDADKAIPMFENIYDIKDFDVSSKCLKQILGGVEPVDCLLRTDVGRLDKIYSIDDSQSIVFNENSQTVIECPNKTTNSDIKAAIVEHVGCGIKTEHHEIIPKQRMTFNINYSSLSDLETAVPEIIYSKISLNNELREKLRKEIDDSFSFEYLVDNNYWRVAFVVILVAIVGYTGFSMFWPKILKFKQNSKVSKGSYGGNININLGSVPSADKVFYDHQDTKKVFYVDMGQNSNI